MDLSTPHVDTIRQDDGQLLAVDTLGKLVYNTVQEEVEELFYHKIVVPRGGEYTVELNDGTRVRLNADSELRFPVKFVGNERKVFLKGEAYFEVERDTSRPFRVDVHGDAIIEVLGKQNLMLMLIRRMLKSLRRWYWGKLGWLIYRRIRRSCCYRINRQLFPVRGLT